MTLAVNQDEFNFILSLLYKSKEPPAKELFTKLRFQKDLAVRQIKTLEHKENVKNTLKDIALELLIISSDDDIDRYTLIQDIGADS